MLKLITDSLEPENPTIPVRWCLEPSDRAKLLELGADNIHVLLVTAYENGAEDRQLRPLAEAMTYVGFRFPGKHTLLARLVWAKTTKEMREIRKNFLQRHDRRLYMHEVLTTRYREKDEEPEFADGLFGECAAMPASEPLDVIVDAGHFPKEPPAWLKDWVNLPYNTPPVDQCAFRRRMFGAFTLQPVVMAILLVIACVVLSAIYLAGLLCVARGLSIKALFRGDVEGIWPKVDTFTWSRSNRYADKRYSGWIWEDKEGHPRLHRLLVSPPALIIYGVVLQYYHAKLKLGYLAVIWLGLTKAWQLAVYLLTMFSLTIVVGALLVSGLILLVYALEKATAKRQRELENDPEYQARIKAEAEEARKRYLEAAYRYLTCPTAAQAPMATTLTALPRERRTVRLRFYDLKRKVCRPYAG